jgi:ComF family protein
LYLFNKGGKIQHLIHQLKYRGKKEIGISLGKIYGQELKISPLFSLSTVIVPVPLHKNKLKKRGYNQSEAFAQGLAESMGIENYADALIRTHLTQTQTKKSRYERWQNVEEIFQVIAPDKLEGKHVLLVDDVVTTGSTLEACANKILDIPNTKVSVVTIASTLF